MGYPDLVEKKRLSAIGRILLKQGSNQTGEHISRHCRILSGTEIVIFNPAFCTVLYVIFDRFCENGRYLGWVIRESLKTCYVF